MTTNYLTPERQEEITQVVENIKLDVGLDYPENSLKSIIKHYIPDVLIKESDFNGNRHIKGAVFRKSKEYAHPVIAIQSHQTKASKTFAMAHEFAHYVLDHNPEQNYLIDDRTFDGSSVMQDETEANFFAQTLLMPRQEFEKVNFPFISDEKLAEYFGVSEGAIRVRRQWLERNGF